MNINWKAVVSVVAVIGEVTIAVVKVLEQVVK